MPEFDAVIAGAGPAGAATAITLARAGRRVLCVEKRRAPGFNQPETLPPLARGIVEHFLGTGDTALAGCAAAARGNISAWGSAVPELFDFFFTPNGAGICVNRNGFDEALRQAARELGVTLAGGTQVSDVMPRDGGWDVSLHSADRVSKASCPILIDATGRSAAIGRLLGHTQRRQDDLFAFGLRFISDEGDDNDGYTRIEACPFGWWYSYRLPGRDGGVFERVVVLHTDRDLPEARRAATVEGFCDMLATSTLMRPHLDAHGYRHAGTIQGAPAYGVRGDRGPQGFLAVGDAAQAFDPLSSQGLTHALQGAAMAGQMVNHALDNASTPTGGSEFLDRHTRDLDARWARYLSEYKHYYAVERRWSGHPFWARRGIADTGLKSDATRGIS